jgi:phosphoglucosamine mutase
VKAKPPLDTLPEIQKLLAAAEADLDGKGRVLLRYSGTEPKIRLLIEGRDQAAIDAHADRIAGAIVEAIGQS